MIRLSLYQQISIHCLYAIADTKMITSLNMFTVAVVSCTVLERLKTNIRTVVCLFGISCHWHGAILLSSDPVELSKVFFILVALNLCS